MNVRTCHSLIPSLTVRMIRFNVLNLKDSFQTFLKQGIIKTKNNNKNKQTNNL